MKTYRNILKKSATMLALIVSTTVFEACVKEPLEEGGMITMTTKATKVGLIVAGGKDVVIDWGDGKKSSTKDVISDLDRRFVFTHDYSNEDIHNIVITGNFMLLACNGNQLTALDVSRNATLKHLNCSENQLTALDVSRNTALNNLECNNNLLTSLNVSAKGTLWLLSCVRNQLTAVALNDLFRTLPYWRGLEYNEIGTIYISYRQEGPVYSNPGNPDCERSIATKKGWEFRSAR